MANAWSFGGGGASTNGATYSNGPVYHAIGGLPAGNINLAGSNVSNYKSISMNGSYSNCYPWYDGWSVGFTSYGGRMYFSRYVDNGYDLYDASDGTYWYNGGLQGTIYWSSVPSAPQAVAISTNSAMTISGTYTGSASNGGETITSYSMQYRTSSNNSTWGAWTGTATVSGGTWSFSGLTPATYYQFRIYANNSEGSSAAISTASAYVVAGGKIWDGTTWKSKVRKVWTGSTWKVVNRKYWNGSSWAPVK